MAPRQRKRSSILARDFKLDMSEVEIVFEEWAEASLNRFPQHNSENIVHDPHNDSNLNINNNLGDTKEEEKEYHDDDHDDDNKYAKYKRQQQQQQQQLSTLKELNSSHHSLTSNQSLTKRAYDSFRHTAAVSFKSSRVDAFLAALGCAGSLAFLKFLTSVAQQFGDYKFYSSCLVGSSIKLFFNESPPSPKAFVNSSILGIVAGLTLHFVPNHCGEAYAQPILLFCTVLYWKLYGSMWTSANALSLMVAMESNGWHPYVLKPINKFHHHPFPWRFLFFQYFTGHALLYGMAMSMSLLRRKIRTFLIQREFVSNQIAAGFDYQNEIVGGKEGRERLQILFNRMDTSGDGQLDVIELQVALRAATGTDISLGDTKEIMQSVDSDGNGTLDFDEFCACIDRLWPEW